MTFWCSLRSFIKILTIAIVFVSLGSCAEKSDTYSKALAVINGKEITTSEFDLRWSQIPEFVRKKYAGAEGRKKFLEELIERELLLQEAKKRGIDRDRVLNERVERFKERSVLDALMKEEVDAR